MRFVYNVLAIIIVIFSMPVFFWRLCREPGFGRRMRQMFGFWPTSELNNVAQKGCLWIHAASVGEVVAAAPIVREMHQAFPERPLLVSTVTATGNEMAHKIIKEAAGIIFFPLDLPWLCTKILQRVDPDLFVLVETELWPNFLLAAVRRKLPVVMVNGRISDKSAQRYHYLRSLLREMIAAVTLFCMQSALDARYALALGAPPERVVVTGNTKFDQVYHEVGETEKRELLVSLGFGENSGPIFIAGSTHPGEEIAVFTAFSELRRNLPTARLILAPRDIRRSGEVVKLAAKFDISMIRRTQQNSGLAESQAAPAVLLDTIGELGRLYSLGDIIFVGGSLIPRGGHNVLEPAAYGKPILVGPHMFNFKESYALLSARGACRTVQNANELAEVLTKLCRDSVAARSMGEAAAAVMQENRGAAQKSVEYMRRYV